MKFHLLPLSGAYLIEIDRKEDERGFFARTFCENEFSEFNLVTRFPQCNISFNKKRGTLRGMHYAISPAAETKLIQCTKGSVYDVIVDLRSDSTTYLQWTSVELSSENRHIIYIPEGFAHGFQTLEDGTELFYHMSVPYNAACARGIRWNDPKIQILWPDLNPILSLKDREYESISL